MRVLRASDEGTGAAAARPRLLFVGAFPPSGSRVTGGNVADCRALLASSFPERVELVLLDGARQGPVSLARRIRDSARRVPEFVLLLHRERPDAVLLFASFGLGVLEKAALAAYARALGVPALLSIRSGHFIDQCLRSRAFRAAARVALAAPARLVCQGPRWQAFYEDVLGIPAARCPVVDAWVATPELLELGRGRPAARAAPPRVLFLGRLDPVKGLLELLDAAAALRDDPAVPEFAIDVGGCGPLEAALRGRIAALGLGARVRLLGLLEGDAKLAALRDADLFVLPSHAEGLPNAMIEAMAAGLPSVVTAVGSIPDVVSDGATGLLVPPRDAVALAAALRRLLVDPALRAGMGREAHRLAAARFSAEQAAARLEALVREVVAGGVPGGRS